MIETDRLILRPYGVADYAPYLAMCSEPSVVRFLGGQPFSGEEAWLRVLRYAGHWSLLGHGMFASIRKDTGEYIGETGIANYRRGLGDSFDKFGEAGWIFSGLVHGQGYAFEAAQAAHKWYHNHMGQNRTVCLIDPDNTSSLKLATRLGYAAFDSKIYKGRAMVMLEREGSA